ncbi:aldo/keto reductase [Candidatus Amarobacter glycogenicus]|uniref:aldo/keto reductase n=1 Tax=Candidatus Amarobacter glycogenicus TaxID=3140699 RepID=UPI003136D274|nr:aldo/keto reductase [Dehalococcoidia bacterium]
MLKKRRLGRTGLMVSELGLGAMDTPHSPEAFETVVAALDSGIDFVDTARDYEGSEHLLGQVVRERGGEGWQIASKTFRHTAGAAQYEIDRSLSVLGVSRLALYQLHDISTPEAWEAVTAEGGALDGLKTAQYRGLIGHIGISTHSLEIARHAILSGEFDTVMLEYSAFYPESAPLIDLAAEHDVGVIAMRPVGGSGRTTTMRGNIARGTAGLLTPANLLRYVLSNPGVSIAIPGARYPSRVFENVATALAFEPMTESQRRQLEAEASRLYG